MKLQAHHLIEKRFAAIMGESAKSMESIALTSAEHQKITNAWRSAIPYNSAKNMIRATKTEVQEAAKAIYAEYPEILKVLGL